MHYVALATDYDGTLAHDGQVAAETVVALKALVATSRKLLLVTGRELPDILALFTEHVLFDAIVAENGALIYWPKEQRIELLGEPPPRRFLDEFEQRGGDNWSQGNVIFATWQPHENLVLDIIRDLGLGYQIIFNKGAVMMLPGGINKATGMLRALRQLEIGPEHVVGIGDAENDHAFLEACCIAVAVANALPTVQQRCDLVTTGSHGAGVAELIGRIINDDLQSLGPRSPLRLVRSAVDISPLS